MPLRLSDHAIATPGGKRRALVATPTEHLRVGRERLRVLRSSLDTSELDQEIVDYIARHPPLTFDAFVFRGVDDAGLGSWHFHEELDVHERNELGYLMWRAQLPLNRYCAAAGIFENLYVDWGPAEVAAFTAATRRIADEIRNGPPLFPEPDTVAARVARLDLWLVERHSFFQALSLDTMLAEVLPPRLMRNDGRYGSLRALIEGLPAAAVDGRTGQPDLP